ncbi:hypothetical protein ACIRNY_10865 [Capnocytophaga canimorsus]|uniref:hypothetical protein n=1 Tax=Capnocytophaga canimorsus TaxID=28188 RepID=UPI00384CBC4A
MKRVIFLMFLVLGMVGCSVDKYEQAIREVNGKEVTPTFEEGNKVYFLNYAGQLLKISEDELKLKNKIDKTTQQVGKKSMELPTKDEKGIVTFYEWETPNVVVLLVSNKSAVKENNHITISVKEK